MVGDCSKEEFENFVNKGIPGMRSDVDQEDLQKQFRNKLC